MSLLLIDGQEPWRPVRAYTSDLHGEPLEAFDSDDELAGPVLGRLDENGEGTLELTASASLHPGSPVYWTVQIGAAPGPVLSFRVLKSGATQTLADAQVFPETETGIPVVPGHGLPAGGTTGQTLTKLTDDDYDAEWEDPEGGVGAFAALSDVELAHQANDGEVLTVDLDGTVRNQPAVRHTDAHTVIVHEGDGSNLSMSVEDTATDQYGALYVSGEIGRLSTDDGATKYGTIRTGLSEVLLQAGDDTDSMTVAVRPNMVTVNGVNVATQTDLDTITEALTAKVSESLYDANTILAANSDDTPTALTVAEASIIGRLTGDNIAALTPAQTRTLLGRDVFSDPLKALSSLSGFTSILSVAAPSMPAAAVGDLYRLSFTIRTLNTTNNSTFSIRPEIAGDTTLGLTEASSLANANGRTMVANLWLRVRSSSSVEVWGVLKHAPFGAAGWLAVSNVAQIFTLGGLPVAKDLTAGPWTFDLKVNAGDNSATTSLTGRGLLLERVPGT